ncbi:alpha/beta hydrolase [Mucilaginibacter sp. SJ]|uniref:alpha/beta hydrolase n=1 Tax=Mucilaginibacter sp. SJ TaxID=3029053 RepID=UPI0023A9AA71|nr:alpha/beta hydrolase [Mucilaginibacter sp. SJ]WEA01785.1 alpha/beta hydrolase [Mucilaginibacter sp. SJ]
MEVKKKRNVLFITGAFVSHEGWRQWQEYFSLQGYHSSAPAWPHKNGTAAELRARQGSDKALARLTLTELIHHYAMEAQKFDEKPIIIGHSLGGLVTQILVNNGFAAAGVAIHPVPPQGIFPYEFSFLRSAWKSLGLFTSLDKTYLMSFKDFQYAFVNGMPLETQRKAYERNVLPESKTVTRGGLTSAAKVDFKKAHVPLLITSGSNDHIIPAHLNARNFKRYQQNGSITEYKEFPGRNHFVLGQPSWKEDADFILQWIEKVV